MQAKSNPLENGTWPRLEFVQNPTFRALTHGLGYSGRVIGSLRLAALLMEPGPLALG
jgi:CO dehydrogenase/acetyl-CoA synthase delta subunit